MKRSGLILINKYDLISILLRVFYSLLKYAIIYLSETTLIAAHQRLQSTELTLVPRRCCKIKKEVFYYDIYGWGMWSLGGQYVIFLQINQTVSTLCVVYGLREIGHNIHVEKYHIPQIFALNSVHMAKPNYIPII